MIMNGKWAGSLTFSSRLPISINKCKLTKQLPVQTVDFKIADWESIFERQYQVFSQQEKQNIEQL